MPVRPVSTSDRSMRSCRLQDTIAGLCRALEPRGSAQYLEGFACFDEQWLRVIAAMLPSQPFGVLELGDREVKHDAALAEEAGGAAEAFVDPVCAAGSVEPGAQPALWACRNGVAGPGRATREC